MRNQQSPLPLPPTSPTEVNDLPLPPTQVVDPARSVVDPDKVGHRPDDLGLQGHAMTLTLAFKVTRCPPP
ncbi:hypothetical protein J6590_032898 [Homalodisca vitripennis]|nr:hypothetical protein J6590_032898 [Homalodisca vitripennis]